MPQPGTVIEITSNDGSITVQDPTGPIVNIENAGVKQLTAGSNVTLTPSDGIGVVEVAASSGSGGYDSLTGPGETTTPGALTQAGGFTVDDSAGDGIYMEGTNVFSVNMASTAGTAINIVNSTGAALAIEQTGNGAITITTVGTGGIKLAVGTGVLTFSHGSPGTPVSLAFQSPSTGYVFTASSSTAAGWAAPVLVPYASLTGAGEASSPGDLAQVGGFSVTEAGTTGIALTDSNTGGINITETDAGAGFINIETSNASNSSGIGIGDAGTGGVNVQYNGAGLLGFFGVSPVAQPAVPTTLAQVITALQALGLVG
jgi:hypothetical protein